jgi:hypothetical protein
MTARSKLFCSHANPRASTTPRRARARQRQEGIVMLIVMILILVATSTGVWALQSTVFEQKASTSLLESNLTRTQAECSAMAGIALEENMMAASSTLDPAWTGPLLAKYFLPALTPDMRSPDFPNGDGGFSCGANAQMRRLPWSLRSRRLHERILYATPGAAAAPTGGQGAMLQESALVVITGYGELALANNPTDSLRVRGIHEVVSISRAYFDSQN